MPLVQGQAGFFIDELDFWVKVVNDKSKRRKDFGIAWQGIPGYQVFSKPAGVLAVFGFHPECLRDWVHVTIPDMMIR